MKWHKLTGMIQAHLSIAYTTHTHTHHDQYSKIECNFHVNLLENIIASESLNVRVPDIMYRKTRPKYTQRHN